LPDFHRYLAVELVYVGYNMRGTPESSDNRVKRQVAAEQDLQKGVDYDD